MDIGVLGYIGILYHNEHPPEVWHIPPGTPCIYNIQAINRIRMDIHVQLNNKETNYEKLITFYSWISCVSGHEGMNWMARYLRCSLHLQTSQLLRKCFWTTRQ
jgi:hypothetical protein